MCTQHFGTIGLSTKPEELALPEYMRERVGPLTVKPEHALISGYFNLDNGGGKLLGIYAENNAAIVPIFHQWIAPLKDLGVTTVSMRNTDLLTTNRSMRLGFRGFSLSRTRGIMRHGVCIVTRMSMSGFRPAI